MISTDERKMIAEAISKARDAFDSVIEDEYYTDPAFYKLFLRVDFLSSEFDRRVHQITDEDEPK